jgi:hypothetical protein
MIRSSLRALVLPGLAGALLAGCATGYTYRSGPGDYYYGQPEVEYRDYGMYGGYGPGWGWYGAPYGYWGGGYPYGYWGPYWEHRHWHHTPPPPDPPPPTHAGPGPGGMTGDRTDRPHLPGRVVRPVPMPAPRAVAPPRPMSGNTEREPHRKITP